MAEIAKAFGPEARGGPQREQRVEHLGQPGDVESLGYGLVQAGTFEIAADLE